MKKVFKSLVAGVVTCGMMTGAASAATFDCSLTNTGPGSLNTCSFNATDDLVVNCNNTATFVLTNSQIAATGAAVVAGNNGGGSSISGDANNINDVQVAVQAGCAQAIATATPTATAPVAPAGGQGAAAPAAKTPAKAQAPARVLPATGVDETVRNAAIGIASLAGVAGVAVAGTSLYRRRALI